MSKSHKWVFKSRFRSNAYGWNGTHLAKKRLKEAVSEIKKVYSQDPVIAGDGIVSLMERLWPALEHIDTSSGALGTAVNRTLEELIPLLIDAPAEERIRRKWLDRLYQAIIDDGVEYLSPAEEHWGEICQTPELASQWADELLPLLKTGWSEKTPGAYIVGATLCLSSLLFSKRYGELYELIHLRETPFWHYDQFWARALVQQGKVDEAIDFTKSRKYFNPPYWQINEFCEQALLETGRWEEAYCEYGLITSYAPTNVALFKKICTKYPHKEPRQILEDLLNNYGSKGKWFAAAKTAGYYDIAVECARSLEAEPTTLIRAACDHLEKNPEFSMHIAYFAIHHLLLGEGYDPNPSDITKAYDFCMAAAEKLGRDQYIREKIIELLDSCHGSPLMETTLTHKLR